MSKFILVRHGQTAWNKEQRFRGRKDVPLSEAGLKEAQAVAGALENASIDLVYASPLSRAMQTLTPLAQNLGKEIEPFEEVIDISFGKWEGMTRDDAKKKYPELYTAWEEAPETVTFPQGESLAEVQARAMRGISRLAVEHPDAAIAVCSHRVVCKLIMLGLLGVKPDRFWAIRQDTACINRFEYTPPNALVITLNETHHLEKLGGSLGDDF